VWGDVSRNNFLSHVSISLVLRFMSICDLFLDSFKRLRIHLKKTIRKTFSVCTMNITGSWTVTPYSLV
jgi:hypothetical protein